MISKNKSNRKKATLRIITGKGVHSTDGPKLLPMVRKYLERYRIPHTYSDGVFEVYGRLW